MPSTDPARRAVVTGLGAVMPIGNDFETYWRNLRNAVTGTRRIRTFDASNFEVQIAAEVLDYDPTTVMDAKMARRMSRFIHLAMGAGIEAVKASGIDFAAMDPDQRDRVGVVVNTGGGGIEEIIDGTHVHDDKGPRFVSPFAIPALSGSMAGCLLSMEYGLTGPVMTQVAACATSVIAFHDALRLIASGECDVVLAGGSEAPVVPMGVAALANMGALSKRNDSPETASRPFDGTRDGFVLGEGAGVVVVESVGACAGPGRDADRRDPRRRAHGRRVPHQRPGSHGPRPGARHDQRPAQLRRGARRGRLDRGARDVDGPQRRHRDARDQGGLRVGGGHAGRLVAQVDDRAPRGRGRDRVGARGPRRDPRRGHRPDGEPAHARTPSATSTTCRWWPGRRRSTPWPSTASGSAARTR